MICVSVAVVVAEVTVVDVAGCAFDTALAISVDIAGETVAPVAVTIALETDFVNSFEVDLVSVDFATHDSFVVFDAVTDVDVVPVSVLT